MVFYEYQDEVKHNGKITEMIASNRRMSVFSFVCGSGRRGAASDAVMVGGLECLDPTVKSRGVALGLS